MEEFVVNTQDNRSCYKKDECYYQPEGINAAYGYNVETVEETMDMCDKIENKENIRLEMLEQIRQYNFAIIDFAEYLDTHPNDRKALCLYQDYCYKLKELENNYQRIFGPLTIYYPCNKWRWLEEPWPWERGDN